MLLFIKLNLNSLNNEQIYVVFIKLKLTLDRTMTAYSIEKKENLLPKILYITYTSSVSTFT